MIVGVPESHCTDENLKRHFHEAYPTYDIDEVQVAHDVSKLCSLDRKRERARRARMYCENYRNKHGSGQQGGCSYVMSIHRSMMLIIKLIDLI